MADTDVQGMLVRIEATTAQLRQEMARADSSVGQASAKIDKSLGRIDTAFDRAGERALDASGMIKTALAGAIGAAGIGKIIEAADSYGQMSDRIGMATSSVSEYDLVQLRLLDTAKRTYRPLAEAQELYIRTADSLKSMGFNTSQALDVMDSFSFLLVTNSASADKASAAIDSYSKALQTGKVEADGWQSIIAAMPTVVDTLAKATGKSAEEIRSLGANGKLGLDLLTNGLQKAAGATGLLADGMSVAVRDAVQNLQNAFTVYIGRLNETTDATGVLASGIGVVGDHFETLANVAIVAAVGALAGYGRAAVGSAAVAIKSAIQDAAARKSQAASVLLVAQAELQKAQTTVFLAEKEAIAARGTAVQTQLSLQLAEARTVEARATNAVAVAQAGVKSASTSLLGVLGGPAGVAMLAVGAATAFLTLRDNTGLLESKLGDLSAPIDELIKKFNDLGRATQAVTLRELRAEIVKTEQQVRESSESIADQFESTLRNAGAAGQDAGLAAGFVELSGDAKAAFDIVKKASEESAKGAAVDWADVANKVRAYPSAVSESMAQDIEKNAGNVEKFVKTLTNQQAVLKATTTDTAADTDARGKNTAAAAEATAAGEKYLEQLNKQLGTLEDKTAAEAAERVILEQKIDTESAVAASIRARAKAIDERKAADDAAAKAERKSTSESASAAKQQLKSFDTAEEGYQRQIELLNTTGDKQKDATEAMKLSFELQEGKLGKLSEAQKKKLMGMAAELDALNKLKKANEDDLKLTAFKNAQALNTQTTKDGFDQELAGVGMGDKARDRMRADLAMRQKYAADVASLNEQRNTGQITPELYANETQVLQDELDKRLLAQENFYAATDEQQANWMNGVNEAWANYANAARDYSAQAADITNTALSEGTSGLGTFFADVASGAEDAGDALGDMVGNFAKSMLKALADMAAQWLIYQGVQLLVGKGTQASSAVMLGANAQAMSLQAGLNAYASTAAIPIIGPAAAPAAMAAALTVTQPLASAVGMTALAGMAHDGIDAVPEDGSWFLQKGERVTTAQTSAKLDAMLSRIDNNLMNAQPQAQIGVGSLESAGNGRAAMVGSSAESTSSGPSQIIFSAPVTVQAQQGMSSQDAQMQGDSIGAALEARMGKFLDAEMRQGGRLWRR